MVTFVDFAPPPSASDSICLTTESVHFEPLKPTKIDSIPNPTWRDLGRQTVTLAPTFVDLNPAGQISRLVRQPQPLPKAVYAAYTNSLLEHHRKAWIDKLMQQFQAEVTRLSQQFRQMARELFQFGQRMATVGAKVALVGGLLLGAMAIPQHTAQAATITVDGAGCTLSDAINSANTGLAYGSCTTGDGAGPDTINLTVDVILGAALPNITSDITIEGNNHYVSGDNNFRVFSVPSAAGILTLNDVTVQDGRTMVGGGGGISNIDGIVNLNNSQVIDNFARFNGGGIYNVDGTINVNNSQVNDNRASNNGGGILNFEGTVNVDNSSVSYNDADYGGGIFNFEGMTFVDNSSLNYNYAAYDGGGIFNNNGTTTIDTSRLSYSFSYYDGGGIFNTDGGVVNVIDTRVDHNDAGYFDWLTYTLVSSGEGGGIFNTGVGSTVGIYDNSQIDHNYATDDGGGIATERNGAVTVDSSRVDHNYSYDDGGGISNDYSGTVYTYNSEIDNNYAYDSGGGISNDDGIVTVTNSQIHDNYAVYGGGIETEYDTLNVINSQIYDNYAIFGGGIENGFGAVYISNSTVSNNYAVAYGGGIASYDGYVSIYNNSTVSDNQGLYGGGIVNAVGQLTVADSTISRNQAVYGGGIDNIRGGTTDLTNTTLNSNRAYYGGAVYNDGTGSAVTIADSLISRNRAIYGGGIDNGGDAALNITGSRLLNNNATAEGGAVWDDASGGTVITTSCIVGNSDTAVYNPGTLGTTQATNNWWGSVDGPGPIGPSVLGDTVSTDVNYAPYLTASILGCPTNLVSASSGSGGSSSQAAVVFDPAISKLGFLMPGQVGVTGERLEWKVTVSNTGTGTGYNVQVTDTLVDALRIDDVDAPGGTVSISGQTVTVTYASLAPGATVNFSIITTVIDGETVENTACVVDPTQSSGLECATALPVRALPETGEIPIRDCSE